jgi:hypothetical protein
MKESKNPGTHKESRIQAPTKLVTNPGNSGKLYRIGKLGDTESRDDGEDDCLKASKTSSGEHDPPD